MIWAKNTCIIIHHDTCPHHLIGHFINTVKYDILIPSLYQCVQLETFISECIPPGSFFLAFDFCQFRSFGFFIPRRHNGFEGLSFEYILLEINPGQIFIKLPNSELLLWFSASFSFVTLIGIWWEFTHSPDMTSDVQMNRATCINDRTMYIPLLGADSYVTKPVMNI